MRQLGMRMARFFGARFRPRVPEDATTRNAGQLASPPVWRRTLGRCAIAAILIQATSMAAYGADDPNARLQIADPPAAVADFQLTNQAGREFRLHDLAGKAVLLFFGFTHCQSVCPPTMQKLRKVYRTIAEGAGSELQCLFVSVDGERDTPEVLSDYLEPFMPGFIGLTGEPKQVSQIAGSFSAVFFKGRQTDLAGGYDVEHTSQVYLIDPAGRLRATFYNAEVDDMVEVTRSVLNEVN